MFLKKDKRKNAWMLIGGLGLSCVDEDEDFRIASTSSRDDQRFI